MTINAKQARTAIVAVGLTMVAGMVAPMAAQADDYYWRHEREWRQSNEWRHDYDGWVRRQHAEDWNRYHHDYDRNHRDSDWGRHNH